MSTILGSLIITPAQAVATALSLVGHSVYELGTGDCDTPADEPTDCAGFAICKCYGLRRHRRGFNHGSWATVSDDINANAIIEDAQHKQELFTLATGNPQPGDLLCYPTIHLQGHTFIGHVVLVVGVSRVLVWDAAAPDWSLLDVVQSCGPNNRRPGIIASDASHFNQHDHVWPKAEHRSVLLRPRQ